MVMGVVRKEAPLMFLDHPLLQVEMKEAKNGLES